MNYSPPLSTTSEAATERAIWDHGTHVIQEIICEACGPYPKRILQLDKALASLTQRFYEHNIRQYQLRIADLERENETLKRQASAQKTKNPLPEDSKRKATAAVINDKNDHGSKRRCSKSLVASSSESDDHQFNEIDDETYLRSYRELLPDKCGSNASDRTIVLSEKSVEARSQPADTDRRALGQIYLIAASNIKRVSLPWETTKTDKAWSSDLKERNDNRQRVKSRSISGPQ